eukprot:5234650-Pyramimonas_sp.AAC.1
MLPWFYYARCMPVRSPTAQWRPTLTNVSDWGLAQQGPGRTGKDFLGSTRSARIRKTDPQPRLPIGGTEPIGSI